MDHPFADLIGLSVTQQTAGSSRCVLTLAPEHLNPHGVVHGAVVFALADTGMGAALYPTLAPGESCATIEVKINYFRPAREGELACETTVVNRGRAVANLESRVYAAGQLIASANGNYAILAPRAKPA
jgi:acyl-CoA thioesterase